MNVRALRLLRLLRMLIACVVVCMAATPASTRVPWSEVVVLVAQTADEARAACSGASGQAPRRPRLSVHGGPSIEGRLTAVEDGAARSWNLVSYDNRARDLYLEHCVFLL